MKVARLWSLDPERLQPSAVFVIKLVQVGGKWFEDSNPSPSKCALPTYYGKVNICGRDLNGLTHLNIRFQMS